MDSIFRLEFLLPGVKVHMHIKVFYHLQVASLHMRCHYTDQNIYLYTYGCYEVVISLAGSRTMIRESKGRDQEQGQNPHVHDLLIDFPHARPIFSVVTLYVANSMLMYFHCLDTDKLWFTLIHRHSSAFEEARGLC